MPVGPSRCTVHTDVVALTEDGVVLSDRGPTQLIDAEGRVRWKLSSPLNLTGGVDGALLGRFGPSVEASAGEVIAASYSWDSCDADPNACHAEDSVPSPAGSVGGHLWTYEDASRSTIAYDRTGARRSKPLPGLPVAVNEDWLVTRLVEEHSVGVYRLTP